MSGAVNLPPSLEAVNPREVAEHVDHPPETVRAVLEALEAVVYDREPWRDPDRLRRLYYEEGLSQSQIADRFGVSQNTISARMQEHGIAPGRGHLSEDRRRLHAADAALVGRNGGDE